MAARKRVDPKSRPADGRRAWDKVDNRDPGRKYVFANPNDESTGVEYYKGLGYDIETKRPDGPRPQLGKTVSDGEAVTTNGQILMSKSLEDYVRDEILPGQEHADAMDRRLTKGGGLDGDTRGSTFQMGVDRDSRFHSAPFEEVEGA